MKNEALFERYKNLCIASLQVTQHTLGDKGLMVWWDKGSDAQMHRLLRGRSGIDDGSNFTDFTPSDLAPYFSAFIDEALKDTKLVQLYSGKDLGPIMVYQLTHHFRRLLHLIIFGIPNNDILEKTLEQTYEEFEYLLYEQDWITATIYPLVNFYSKSGWEQQQQLRGAINQRTTVLDETVFSIDNNFEIKQINFITPWPLLDKSAETSLYRARSAYRDFTGDYFVLEARASASKTPASQANLTSYLIGRPPEVIRDDDVSLKQRIIVPLSEWHLLSLRLLKSGDIGIAPYRYISDYPSPLYVPDLYQERYFELAQVEAYEDSPYILDTTEVDTLKKLYQGITNLFTSKANDLKHIEIAQRYFQYGYSHKLTDGDRLQDRVVNLVFALEALLLKQDENSHRLKKLAAILIDDSQKNTKHVLTEAYTKVRNPVAHGRAPEKNLDINFVKNLEDYVRQTIRRAIGLAINGVRSKDALQNKIDEAEVLNKATKSENGAKKLRKGADDPFS